MPSFKKTLSNGTTQTFSIDEISVEVNQNPEGPVPTAFPFVLHADNEEEAKTILLGVRDKKHILLKGPTGCGKTATIRHLAFVTNNAYRRMQLTGATSIDNFVGRYILNEKGTEWRDGILLEAMKKGQWLILDELNMALPEITAVLNAVMDDDYQMVVDEHEHETVVPHPNFRIFACINPSEDYAGTKEINRALLDRFDMILNFKYSKGVILKKIVKAHTGLDDKFGKTDERKGILDRMIEFATVIRKKYEENQMAYNCSDRQMIQWGHLVKGLGVKKAAKVTILGKCEVEEHDKIKAEIDKLFRDDEDISYDVLVSKMNAEQEEGLEEELNKARSLLTELNESENLKSEVDMEQNTTTADQKIDSEDLPF